MAAYQAMKSVKYRVEVMGASPRCLQYELEQVVERDLDPFFILEEIAGAHTADLLRGLLKDRGWE